MYNIFEDFTLSTSESDYKQELNKPVIDGGLTFLKFRPWQRETIPKFIDAKLTLLNAPTGAGKTLNINALVHYKLKRDLSLKSIIVAPRREILLGYESECFVNLDGENIVMTSTLIEDDHRDKMLNFLNNRKRSIKSRSLVCTHQFLVSFFKSLTKAERHKYFGKPNLMITVDEAHYMSAFETFEGEEDQKEAVVIMNEICSVVNYFANHGQEVHLSSATPFRTNGAGMIHNQDKYVKSVCDYQMHLSQNCHYLKNIVYNTVFFDDIESNFIGAFKDIIRTSETLESTLLIIPPTNSSYEFAHKLKEVQLIKEAWNEEAKRRNQGEQVIMDLVDDPNNKLDKVIFEENKKAKKIYTDKIINNQESDNKPKINLIIAMKKFTVGSDYTPISRIIAPHTVSMVKVIQTSGRGFRDYVDKNTVKYYSYVKRIPESFVSTKDTKVVINENLQHIFMTLMMEHELNALPKINEKKSGFKKTDLLPVESWIDAIGRENLVNLKRDIFNATLKDISCVDDVLTNWEILEYNAEEILVKHGVKPKHRKKFVKDFKLRWGLKILRLKGVPESNYTLEFLETVHPGELFTGYYSKKFDSTLYKNMRKVLSKNAHGISVPEALDMADKFVKKHNRTLKFSHPESDEERLITSILRAERTAENQELFEKFGLSCEV